MYATLTDDDTHSHNCHNHDFLAVEKILKPGALCLDGRRQLFTTLCDPRDWVS